MEKSNKGLFIIIVILVILLLGSVSYITYDKYIEKNDKSAKTETKTEKTKRNEEEEKTEKLDVNGGLVQSLYKKFIKEYWVYQNNDDKFIAKSGDNQTEMNLVGLNLQLSELIYTGCSSDIPDGNKSEGEYSICKFNELVPSNNGVQTAYSKEYIESVYKELFGREANLNTSVDIAMSSGKVKFYRYVPSANQYIEYHRESGDGTSCGRINSEVIEAVKMGEELKITEKVTQEDCSTSAISEAKYVYTFKLEDGLYVFASRIKE